MRKKRSEMTPMERVEYIMKESTWEDAEEVGIEILARCSAMHVYARKEEDYVVDLTMKLTERVCKRADEWAHEKNNPFVLACASIGHQMEQKKVISINEGKKFASEVKLDTWHVSLLGFKASVDIGEDYYETGPYKSKDLALCEVKGFLEGVKAKIEGVLQSIEREINEDNQDTTRA